ncbi:low molecular weight phosphatase family protein [Gryllotalpicola reticulitermitis]|uniref:Low molecular weight phosphatase family protein n=1 Tax=Gryllotalpicola reticulitermitis TaxID=1184153 RepID=A0ABV8Q788_9MICO
MNTSTPFRVLAVCSGNVCRSPLAELLLRNGLSARADLVVVSAGTIARPGQRMAAEMISAGVPFGLDPDAAVHHRAARLSEQSVAKADLILGLTREHRAAAVGIRPGAVSRTFTLNEFSRLVSAAEARSELTPAALVAGAASRRGPGAPRDPSLDDIDDPIGLPREEYDRVSAEIAQAVQGIVHALLDTKPSAGAQPRAPGSRTPALSFSFRPS